MALKLLACVAVAALAVTGCKDKSGAHSESAGSGAAPCDDLAKSCGDSPKHIEKIVVECKEAAAKKAACPDKINALIGCYERDVCGSGEKVWALEDLKVLAERHQKCATERAAVATCGDSK